MHFGLGIALTIPHPPPTQGQNMLNFYLGNTRLLQQLQPAKERLTQGAHSVGSHGSLSLTRPLRGSWHLPLVPRPPSGASSDTAHHGQAGFSASLYIYVWRCSATSVLLSQDP